MGTQLSAREGAQQAPTFRPMSIVAKRSPISATAEVLFCFFRYGTLTDASVVYLIPSSRVYRTERPLLFTTRWRWRRARESRASCLVLLMNVYDWSVITSLCRRRRVYSCQKTWEKRTCYMRPVINWPPQLWWWALRLYNTSLAATFDVALYAAGAFMLSRAKLKRTALLSFFTPGRLASASKVDCAHANDLRFLILSSRWLAPMFI